MKPYWHELTFEQQQAVINRKDPERVTLMGLPESLTIAEFIDMYQQPDWCEYPHALGWIMGCWSLCNVKRKIISSVKDCGNCECIKKLSTTLKNC